MPISAAKAHERGTIAGIRRAIRNGEQTPGSEQKLRDAYKELAVITVEEESAKLAAKAAKLVADWPDLTDEQLGRVAGILRAAESGGRA